jgi:hypothetical protein
MLLMSQGSDTGKGKTMTTRDTIVSLRDTIGALWDDLDVNAHNESFPEDRRKAFLDARDLVGIACKFHNIVPTRVDQEEAR